MKVISLILSAGESSRMGGKTKALLQWNGKTLLAHAAIAARDASISHSVVVIGAHADAISPEAKNLNLEVVLNENWAAGMGSSIKAGIDFIQKNHPDASAILIQLVDQPKVSAKSLTKIISAHTRHQNQPVCAKYENSPGVPALFPKSLFSSLLSIGNAEGAKKLLIQNADTLMMIDMPEAQEDIDTPEQFARLQK